MGFTSSTGCAFPNIQLITYIFIDGQTERQVVPKLLLPVPVGELRNIILIPPEEGGLKEARENKIVSLSMIKCHAQLFHPNGRIFLNVTSLCMGVSVAYLPKVCIRPF